MGEISPALLDLMEHEKVIEQGLQTFVDVGWALLQIRDGRKYRAAGFDTFERYVVERWEMRKRHAYRLMDAAATVAEVCPTGHERPPERERQVRPLTRLPSPEAKREAWAEAVVEADDEQPTAAQVERAVARRLPPKREHPAPFSDPILQTAAKHVGSVGSVLDPFAGIGRVHELRDIVGVERTIGLEIEPEWAAKHPDTIHGDALALHELFEPASFDAIATSPTYGNRMADHHNPQEESVRMTYKHTLGRDLAQHNSGQLQWGDDYRNFHLAAWEEAFTVLRPGGTFTINIKNHVRGGEVQRVMEWHMNALMDLGLRLIYLDAVPTRGLMAGANADARTDCEYVITFRKP